MKKIIALHLLIIAPLGASFQARSFSSTSDHLKCSSDDSRFSDSISLRLPPTAIRLPSRLHSSNGNKQEKRYIHGFGSSYLQQLEQGRNPNPVFPSYPSVPSNHGNQPLPLHHQQQGTGPASPGPSAVLDSPAQSQPHPSGSPQTSGAPATTNPDGFKVSPQGMYQIQSEEDYRKLISAFPDKLIVVKFFASFCRTCKALAPKMVTVMRDKQLEGLPILWAEFESLPTNKDVFRKVGVMTLPTIHFYDGDRGLAENFPCPPSKVPLLKKKLARFLNTRIDANTRQLLLPKASDGYEESIHPHEPRVERTIINNELISAEHMDFLRNDLPFFQELTDQEFDDMIQKARLVTFDPGDIIMRQGMSADTFYVIKSGSVEMSIRSKFDDPIRTPPTYLGAVVSTLRTFDYFGERALTTGEPFAASFRSLDKTRCFAFHVDIIPPSSILSKKKKATKEIIDMLNQRYVLPEGYKAPTFHTSKKDEGILELLVRFKQIRQAAKCLDYIMQTGVDWGDKGAIARRTILVSKLTYAQQNEFNDVFNMVDGGRCGRITLQQIREFMARGSKNGQKIGAPADGCGDDGCDLSLFLDGDIWIPRDEFMGVMAEAEFYNLFKETFQELDKENTGFVRAGDLDQILGGVRDLIGDKRQTNIIDVDDMDMLVDYEQFSRMLLGAAI